MKIKYEAPEVTVSVLLATDTLIVSGLLDTAVTDPPDAGWSELKPLT